MERSDIIASLIDAGPTSGMLSVLGPHMRILAEFGTADDAPSLIYGEMGPGAIVPLHSHGDDESWYVVRGALQAYREGDGWAEFGVGSSLHVAGGIRHALRNTGDVPAGTIILATVKLARFFRTVGKPMTEAPAGPPSREAVAEFAEAAGRFGYWLGAPDDNASVGLRMG